MASSFAELYSDYIDKVKVYVEQLDVTPHQFMRELTRGMQKFQRETEYVESRTIIRKSNNEFLIPQDTIRILEVRDENGEYVLSQHYDQFVRNVDRYPRGFLETPTDFVLRTTRGTRRDIAMQNRQLPALRTFPSPYPQRLFTVVVGRIILYPPYDGNTLNVLYIPDIHAFSRVSPQWQAWFAQPDSFDTLFATAQINPILAPYEDAFVKYAIMEYIRSKGSANFRVFEQEFWQEVERAKINKPTYHREAVADYFFAPYS